MAKPAFQPDPTPSPDAMPAPLSVVAPGAVRKAFLLRLDPALWAELEAWAQQELRSVNGQMEFLLREAVRRRKAGAKGALEKRGKR